MRQISFSQQKYLNPKLRAQLNPVKEFGGNLLRGKRKSKRPFNAKLPMHTIMRCSTLRSGSLLWNADKITSTLEKYAEKFGVKIYERAIASNHLHMILKFPSRKAYNSFVRAFSGVLAKFLRVMWSVRPWTRILSWGRDFRNACSYTIQNELEATGVTKYTPRKRGNSGHSGVSSHSHLPKVKELNK